MLVAKERCQIGLIHANSPQQHNNGDTCKKKIECASQTSDSEAKRREERMTLTDDACAGIFFNQGICGNIVH